MDIEFDRAQYSDCAVIFEERTVGDVDSELSEFNNHASDLAYELAYTRYALAKVEQQRDALLAEREQLLAQQVQSKPDAYVPVHTRTGEHLWANTVTSLDQDHPSSYKMAPVYLQPSPAVAVHDRWQDKLELAHMKGQSFAGIDPSFSAAQECAIKMMQGLTGSQSPRITEQDAREIIDSYREFVFNIGTNGFECATAFKWLETNGALLNKLNAKPESVGG